MTHDDLATLLREDLAATEPTHIPDARVPVRLGRRRLRTRRLVAGATAAAVVAIGAAVAVPLVRGDDTAGPRHAIDPASQKALDEYDARRMPQLMDEHVRSVLERSVPDPGGVAFVETDGGAGTATVLVMWVPRSVGAGAERAVLTTCRSSGGGAGARRTSGGGRE